MMKILMSLRAIGGVPSPASSGRAALQGRVPLQSFQSSRASARPHPWLRPVRGLKPQVFKKSTNAGLKARSPRGFLVSLIVGLMAVTTVSCSKGEKEAEPLVTVQVAVAERGKIEEVITADAILFPRTRPRSRPKSPRP